MPSFKFTTQSIKALKPSLKISQKDYWDSELKGFGIRVSAWGRKSWIAFYRVNGKAKRLTLGTYPLFSLSEARRMAKQAIKANKAAG